MRQLFISDLHLWQQAPEIEALFHQFMREQAQASDELYVLGDLFEAWIGDDALDALAERVITTFQQYSSTVGKLYFMHGNRDFLLGDTFIAETGGTLLSDPHELSICNQPSLLMHGDSLCTQDVDYISFRDTVRNPEWQQQFLSFSIDEREQIARDIRDKSQAKGQTMSEEISDVTPSEVIRVMDEHAVTLLIHGHTHRQARHSLSLEHAQAERIVLGDWGNTGSVLTVDDSKIELSNFSLSNR